MVADSPLPNNQQRGDDGKLSRQYVLGQMVYESPSIAGPIWAKLSHWLPRPMWAS
jgi:hypothetical protein